jgi:hypothetical protein
MYSERLTAGKGSFLVADTTNRTSLEAYAFIVQEDTVVATAQGGSTEVIASPAAINFVSTMGISGKTLKAGALFVCPTGTRIQTFKLTGGSVILYS